MKARLAFVVAALLLVSVAPTMGADLAFSPTSLTMALPGGQSGSTLAGVTVNNMPPVPFTMTVRLRSSGGSLPPSWLTSRPVTITRTTPTQQMALVIAVPPGTPGGPRTAVLVPEVLFSTIPLAPTSRPLMVTVNVVQSCSAAPTVNLVPTDALELRPPNGRLEEVSVGGTIGVPAGCTLRRAWYGLEDEYGLLGKTEDFTPASDGSFSLTVPVEVSRRGDDKDGRVYRVMVFAENEVGTGASEPRTITVSHDQRKDK